MSTPTIIPQSKATEFLTNPQSVFGESQRQILNLFNPQNIILFAVGLTVIILGGILFGYLVLLVFYKIQIYFDKRGKDTNYLEICFDRYIDYEDTKFLQVMDNFFKRDRKSVV